MRTERWKAFQILLLQNENTHSAHRLAITSEMFQRFIDRHTKVRDHGIEYKPETDDDMVDTYIMLLPDGRFFSNHGGRYVYGQKTIFEVGVSEALAEVPWDHEKFERRGGVYEWG